ncbi:MAG: VOC family protein [Armatimonadetes bacterium]|nr:VOC family protein [Armatimonadota bacterium]
MPKVNHFEIPADDTSRATEFYKNVFGWQFQQWGDQPYFLTRAGDDDEPGAGGAITTRSETNKYPVLVLNVANIDESIKQIGTKGGKIVMDKMPIPTMGWFAYFTDTEGNTMGVFQMDPTAPDSESAISETASV